MQFKWVSSFITRKVAIQYIIVLILALSNVLSEKCGFNPLRVYYPDIKMSKTIENRSPASFCPIINSANICCDRLEFQKLPLYIGNRYEEWVLALQDIHKMFVKWNSVYLTHT